MLAPIVEDALQSFFADPSYAIIQIVGWSAAILFAIYVLLQYRKGKKK